MPFAMPFNMAPLGPFFNHLDTLKLRIDELA